MIIETMILAVNQRFFANDCQPDFQLGTDLSLAIYGRLRTNRRFVASTDLIEIILYRSVTYSVKALSNKRNISNLHYTRS